MIAVVIPIEEKDVPEPRAENPRQPAIDPHVDNMMVPAPVLLREEIGDARRQHDGQAQHQPVGADGEIADIEKKLMHERLRRKNFFL